jgi:hypothetical protein
MRIKIIINETEATRKINRITASAKRLRTMLDEINKKVSIIKRRLI